MCEVQENFYGIVKTKKVKEHLVHVMQNKNGVEMEYIIKIMKIVIQMIQNIQIMKLDHIKPVIQVVSW
jgi:hypothetical protein